jgi:hypothetical protein
VAGADYLNYSRRDDRTGNQPPDYCRSDLLDAKRRVAYLACSRKFTLEEWDRPSGVVPRKSCDFAHNAARRS